MVDWEAGARGPAVVDLADAALHALHDLVYTQRTLEMSYVDEILRLEVSPPVLAWRVALWLDRRRPGELDLLSEENAAGIARAPGPEAALRSVLHATTAAHAQGRPR